jgi:hypothetical protein
MLATFFGCKKPSSGQNRTMSGYNEVVHSMGSHIFTIVDTLRVIYWVILKE